MNGHDHTRIERRLGLSRRDFLKFCAGVAATLGLPGGGVRIAEAVTDPQRPVVIWLSGQECTGCTESLLRATHPTVERLLLELISLEYSELLGAAAGHRAEAHQRRVLEEHNGRYLLVVEGAIPVADGGIYCKIANRTLLEHVRDAAAGAAAVAAIGSCAAWGGIPASGPNPTGAVGVPEVVTGKPLVAIPGCPPNPYNFLATVLHFITYKTLPALDHKRRPRFAYGRLIHDHCERRVHFKAGRFARQFGDEGHRRGWCLYYLGCKGTETYANCPSVLFGDGGPGSWPVRVGHPCFGCTEQGVGFAKGIHQLAEFLSPDLSPRIHEDQGRGMSPGAAALAAGGAGAALYGWIAAARSLNRRADEEDDKTGE